MVGASKQHCMMNFKASDIGTLGNAFDVRIDTVLTLCETLVKRPIVLVGKSRVTLKVPIETQCAGLTVLIAKINNIGMFLEHHYFVEVYYNDVRLQL